jgi:hypothetical protein
MALSPLEQAIPAGSGRAREIEFEVLGIEHGIELVDVAW